MNRPYFISRADLMEAFPMRAARQFEELQVKVAEVDDVALANVGATGALKDASFVTLSSNAELPNERVLQLGMGLSFDLGDGTVTITTNGLVKAEGGHGIRLVAGGDTELALPLAGTLATRENAEVLRNKTLAAPLLSGLIQAVDDAAAASAGIPVGGVYRDGSALKVRVV